MKAQCPECKDEVLLWPNGIAECPKCGAIWFAGEMIDDHRERQQQREDKMHRQIEHEHREDDHF